MEFKYTKEEFNELERTLENWKIVQTIDSEITQHNLKKPSGKNHLWSLASTSLGSIGALALRKGYSENSFAELKLSNKTMYEEILKKILACKNYNL
jgi:hypothetical protein